MRKTRFGGRGDIGHSFEPRRCIDCEDADFPAAMQGDHLRGDVHKADGDLSAQEVVHRRRHAFVGDMNDVEPAGHLLEHLDGDVRDRAGPARAVGELAGVGLDVLDQLLHGLGRHRWIDGDRRRCGGEDRRRHQLPGGVVDAIAQPFPQHQVAGAPQQEGVAVGLRLGDGIDRDGGAASAAIFDDDRAERRLDPVGPDACDDVVHTARRRRNDEADRAAWIVLLRLLGRCRAPYQGGCGGHAHPDYIAPSHVFLRPGRGRRAAAMHESIPRQWRNAPVYPVGAGRIRASRSAPRQ